MIQDRSSNFTPSRRDPYPNSSVLPNFAFMNSFPTERPIWRSGTQFPSYQGGLQFPDYSGQSFGSYVPLSSSTYNPLLRSSVPATTIVHPPTGSYVGRNSYSPHYPLPLTSALQATTYSSQPVQMTVPQVTTTSMYPPYYTQSYTGFPESGISIQVNRGNRHGNRRRSSSTLSTAPQLNGPQFANQLDRVYPPFPKVKTDKPLKVKKGRC